MVDVLGHLGMALVWLAPSWYLFDRQKTAFTFVAIFFWFGMLPDVDLVASSLIPGIHHHGIFHTVLVVTILAVVVGPLVGWIFEQVIEKTGRPDRSVARHAVVIGIAGVWVTGISHLFADILSAPDASTVIEPLWPLVTGPLVSIDVLYYQSVWARWGLLVLGLGANVAAWYATREPAPERRDVAGQ